MADEPAAQPNGTPPAATPPAAAPAPAAAKPNGQRPNGQRPNGKPKRPPPKMVTFIDKNGRELSMPEHAFQARLAREATAMVRKRLGVTLEEAERIVKTGGAPAPAASAAAPNGAAPSENAQASAMANEAVRRLTAENKRLTAQRDGARKRAEDADKKRQREVQRLKDREMDAVFRAEAIRAGIKDPEYAVYLFGQAAAAGKFSDPAPFFVALKKTHEHLFVGGAPATETVDVPASTAPPESQQPGEEKPKPPAAGAPNPVGPGGKGVDQMSPQEFAQHQSRYGFRAGM